MTSFPSPSALDALRLSAAVGDAEAGRRPGFSERAAAIAAAFAAHRRLAPEPIEAAWFAALLGEAGRVKVRLGAGLSERLRRQALWDAPLESARLVGGVAGLPPGTADLIRWHRERHDGTGFPDRLRWAGIPVEAAAVGIVRDYLGRIEDASAPVAPEEALFGIVAEAGSAYAVELVEAFRHFALLTGAAAPDYAPATAPLADPLHIVGTIIDALDARDDRDGGRAARRGSIARAVAAELGRDPDRAALAARMTVLGAVGATAATDDLDPLSRFARDARADEAARAATIVRAGGAFAAYGAVLAQTAERWDGSGLPERRTGITIDPLARVVAVAVAAQRFDALGRAGAVGEDGPHRIGAAAGTIFEPDAVRAYLAVGVPL